MANYQRLKEKVEQTVRECLQEMIAHSDYVSDHPELSGEEYETSAKMVNLLRSHGFRAEYPFAGYDTAFKAVKGSDSHRYKAALLAEYDALPDIGHACGHSVSGTITLLAAIACAQLQDELDCDIHVIGTPQEETEGAKCVMAAKGIFKPYDMAMMVHLYDQNLSYCTLNGLASMQYTFHGKASHAGAAPWDGRNALNAAALMLHGLDCIRGCCTPDTRINSVMLKGGAAAGSIPEEAEVETWIRCPDSNYLEQVLYRRVDNCAKGAALMAECTWEKYMAAIDYKSMKRNAAGERAIREVFAELGIEINGDPDKLFGSSDIGNVSFECPAFHPTLQIADKGTLVHTRGFQQAIKSERAHLAIANGAKLIAFTIAKIFSDEERIRQMKADFC